MLIAALKTEVRFNTGLDKDEVTVTPVQVVQFLGQDQGLVRAIVILPDNTFEVTPLFKLAYAPVKSISQQEVLAKLKAGDYDEPRVLDKPSPKRR